MYYIHTIIGQEVRTMKYYFVEDFVKQIGKNPQTLKEWDKKDIFKPHHVAQTAYRYYS